MRAVFITIFIALLLGGGGTFMWLYYGGFEEERAEAMVFIETYGDYAEVADRVELLAHIPGAEANTDRAELLSLLSSILTETMEQDRRETLARLAFANLDTIKKEVDAAQSAQARLYEELQELDNAGRMFRSVELRNLANDVVVLARKRAELTSRITAIQSEMNEHTYTIITRILAEKGALSQAHIQDINESTDHAEERFETLSGLYTQLIEGKQALDSSFNEFVSIAM